ncbi:MAG: NUDIX hydrolase [Firmicutes bacterium]|nr:NUDIX hydrolase [Bacillota bacterium]
MAFKFTRKMAQVRGQMREYHIVEHDGAVAMIPYQYGTITLVKQTRPAIGGKLLEIPAGSLEKGEHPFACAQRELAEETGWRAQTWHKLGELYLAPGYSSEILHLYLATDLSMGEQDLDDSEDIEVVHLPLREALRMAQMGEFRDAKTIAAIFHLQIWAQDRERLQSKAQ